MLNIAWLLALACRHRRQIFDAFTRYFTKDSHENGSPLVKARYQAAEKNDMPIENIARLGLAGHILVNAVSCFFWVLVDVYSNHEVLRSLHDEISTVTKISHANGAEGSIDIPTLDIERMRTECKFIPTVFHETLRIRSTGSTIRHVREDCFLDGHHFLKKGGLVQMPLSPTHYDKQKWGLTADQYDPQRSPDSYGDCNGLAKHGAFRAFGGGAHLCQGRQFATAEIISARLE